MLCVFNEGLQARIKKVLAGAPGKIQRALQISQKWAVEKGTGVPPIIMQTWKDENVPKHWEESPTSFKEGMPDWHYVLMTDADNLEFVQKLFPQFLRTYQNLRYPIMRADAIRYMWLYVVGGVYADLDFKLKKDLSPLIDQADGPLYLVQSGNSVHTITNSFMASKPGVPVWKDALSTISFRSNPKHEPWWFFSKHWRVMGTTGPIMLQSVVDKSKIPYVALPTTLINPCSVCEVEFGKICDPKKVDNAYFTHLRGSSWHSDDSSLLNNIFCRPQDMAVGSFLILGLGLALVIYAFKRGGAKMGWLVLLLLLAALMVIMFPKIFI